MAIVGLRDWATGETITATKLNDDRGVIEAKFSTGIVSSDIADGAITNGKLANKHYEMVLTLRCDGVRFNAAAAGDYLDFVGLPADVNEEDYTIEQADFVQYNMTAGGGFGGTAEYDIVWGYFGAADSGITVTDTIKDQQATVAVTADQGAAGTIDLDDDEVTTSSTNKHFFALRKHTAEAAWASADEILVVTLKLKRTDGLRS